jgi:hypothetical protein
VRTPRGGCELRTSNVELCGPIEVQSSKFKVQSSVAIAKVEFRPAPNSISNIPIRLAGIASPTAGDSRTIQCSPNPSQSVYSVLSNLSIVRNDRSEWSVARRQVIDGVAVLACLLAFSAPARAYEITLYPAASVFVTNPELLDFYLGLPDQSLFEEGFEAETLKPSIKSSVKGHADDPKDASASAWDGLWPSAPSDGDAAFDIAIPKIRTFGVGVSNLPAAADLQVSIDSGPPIQLRDLSGYRSNADGRAFYLKIEAEPGDADIQSVRILNAGGVRFDHLVLWPAAAPSSLPAPAGNPNPPAIKTNSPVAAVTVKPAASATNNPAASAAVQSPVKPSQNALTPPATALWNRGVALLSRAGRKFIGNQAQGFFIDPDGAITSSKPQWLSLYFTEGQSFRLHGEVWLGGPSRAMAHPEDLPDGFALFIREWDGTQRYAFTSRGIDVKRRMVQGAPADGIVNVSRWDEPGVGKWIPFYIDVAWDRIAFFFGSQAGSVKGPLDVDGANKIAIAPGTKLRDLRLEIFSFGGQ